MVKKQWGGRFSGSMDRLMERLGESVSFDSRLALWDIRASRAHARMLGVRGIIDEKDAKAIIRGLDTIERDIQAGNVVWDVSLEDVHTNIESMLIARVGDAGKKLHTARSRNDQIATDVRLWLRDQVDNLLVKLRGLRQSLVCLAERYFDVLTPGFTHLQHAQPVLFAHHMLAYYEMFTRDRNRLRELRKRVNIMPLGSAALAGTPHPIDREMVARELGFEGISANSMDAVADRDHLIEFCCSCALIMIHLSRMAEELILWSSQEFNFIEIGDAFTTGSSIMPQKKNPDAAELTRGRTAGVIGDLMTLFTLIKGIPLTYNRDLQEDKPPLFHAADSTLLCVEVFARMLETVTVNEEAMRQALRQGFLEATDLADYLAARGVPFREAHEIMGRVVRRCIELGTTLPDLPLEEYRKYSPVFSSDLYHFLKPEVMAARRDVPGGTAPKQVRRALARAKRMLRQEETG